MYKIAVLGDRDSIYGFAALGLDIYPIQKITEAAKKLKHLAESNYAVIYITEAIANELASEIDQYRTQKLPAIIPVPGISGNTGIGMENVRKSVEQAVGSDTVFYGENKKVGEE